MSDIKVGDLVENVNAPDLDHRRVTRIEGTSLWLATSLRVVVGVGEMGPFSARAYRVVDVEGGAR